MHEKKTLLFLKEDILIMRTKQKARGTNHRTGTGCPFVSSPQMLPLTPETIEASYVSPLIDPADGRLGFL